MTLAEIKAAAALLSPDEQMELFESLKVQMRKDQPSPNGTHSVIDIPAVSVGRILQPLTREDDLLDEMLEGRL